MGRRDCQPPRLGNCFSGDLQRSHKSTRAKRLAKLLVKILKEQGFEADESDISAFADTLAEREELTRRWHRLLEVAHRLPETDIVFWIRDAADQGDMAEALWRAFLAGHFGRPSANESGTQSAARLLTAFGERPYWTWARVSSDRESLKAWLIDHCGEVRSLRFGNHRKYESTQPQQVFRIISSFLDWVERNGGTPAAAFEGASQGSPAEGFDRLFRSLREISHFGRTGTFDLLCLIGGMGILPVRPGSCYLLNSTGPMRGAIKLWGRLSCSELGRLADETAKAVEIAYEVFEDALCMWQK